MKAIKTICILCFSIIFIIIPKISINQNPPRIPKIEQSTFGLLQNFLQTIDSLIIQKNIDIKNNEYEKALQHLLSYCDYYRRIGYVDNILEELVNFYIFYDSNLSLTSKYELYTTICQLRYSYYNQFQIENQLTKYFNSLIENEIIKQSDSIIYKRYHIDKLLFNDYYSDYQIDSLSKLAIKAGNNKLLVYSLLYIRYRYNKNNTLEKNYLDSLHHYNAIVDGQEIGVTYRNIDSLDLAEKYLLESKIIHSDDYLFKNIICNINLAKLYIKTKQYDLSEKYLDTSYNVANDLKSIYYIQEINNAYASLYKAKGDYKNYILSSEKMNQFILTNSINQKIAKSIDWINLNNKEKEVYRVKNKYLIFSLIVFCIVVITIILILKKYIDYKNKSELILVTEFEVIENKRNEDNIYLNQLKSNLNINNHSGNDVDHSNTLLELKLLNEISNNWETYQLKFNAVFPNFFKNLNNLNQNLTDLDLKHASFIKLNLSTFEVANMLGINIQSVATFRYRLKQKLNLDKDVSLRSFLLSL